MSDRGTTIGTGIGLAALILTMGGSMCQGINRQIDDVDGDVQTLRNEMNDRIGDVDGDVATLREDMNRQFDRLHDLIQGLHPSPPAQADE